MRPKILALVALMNLALFLDVRLLVLPTAEIWSPWWIVFGAYGLAFQFNWVMLMVGAFWSMQSSASSRTDNK